MQHLVADQEHRPIGKVKTLCGQLLPEIIVATPIPDREAGNTATQFAQLGKMSAKGTATVKHQHGIIPITVGDGCCHQSVKVNRQAAWRSLATAAWAFVVQRWQQQVLQLPRTNNAGPPAGPPSFPMAGGGEGGEAWVMWSS